MKVINSLNKKTPSKQVLHKQNWFYMLEMAKFDAPYLVT